MTRRSLKIDTYLNGKNGGDSQTPTHKEPSTPKDETTMKTVLEKDFVTKRGIHHDFVTFFTSSHKPSLSPEENQLLVKIHSCCISPRDRIMLGSQMMLIRSHDASLDLQMDICGIVEDMTEGAKGDFQIGDAVVAINSKFPVGGITEYVIISSDNAVLKPMSVDAVQASACSSAVTAIHATDNVCDGDRVLILGGDTDLGLATIQLCKNLGASFIAATSTSDHCNTCSSFGADKVINTSQQNWWEIEEFHGKKLDKVIDFVGKCDNFEKARHILKCGSQGGAFIGSSGGKTHEEPTAWLKGAALFAALPLRELWTRMMPQRNPKLIALLPYVQRDGLKRVMRLMEDGKLTFVMDSSSPHPFSEEGVKIAFEILTEGRARGRVVIRIEAD